MQSKKSKSATQKGALKRQVWRFVKRPIILGALAVLIAGGIAFAVWQAQQANKTNQTPVSDDLDVDKNITDSKAAIQKSGNNATSAEYVELGQLYKAKNDATAAEEALKKAEQLSPNDVDVLSALVALYRREHNKTKAVEYYNKLIQIVGNPTHEQYDLLQTYKDELQAVQQDDFDLKTVKGYIEGLPL